LWVTDFGLARMHTDARLTRTGDLVGTLRYMSPEQALAQPVGVDHRTDLYALGATLYELLTLEPAFPGRDRQELLRQIAFEEPKPPRRVNKAVPAELETIVLKALAKSPDERYATAQELADDLRRFLGDQPIRARRPSWLERARKWARRHRPVVCSAAVALLVTLAVLAGCVGWVVRDRAARQARIAADLQAALEAAQRSRREGQWPQAQAAAKRAEALLQDGTAEPALAERVRGLLRELAEEEGDGRLVARLDEIRLLQAEVNVEESRFVLESALPEYRQAFGDYGWRPGSTAPEEAAAGLRRRPPAVRGTLVAALDHWLILARYRKAPEAGWLEHVLSAGDSDAWRQGVRAARVAGDRQALEKLAREVDAAAQPPEELFLLDMSLRQRGAKEGALALLRRAQEAFPGDFWINHDLGMALQDGQPPQYDEAIRFLTVAAALRPNSPGVCLNLGGALFNRGRVEEAAAAFRKALALRPGYAMAHHNLGLALSNQGRLGEAAAAFRRAIELKPDHAEAHCQLGQTLRQQGDFVQALAALRQGHELGSRRPAWPYPSAQWVRECRRLVELDGREEAVLRGEAQVGDAAERSDYARLCFYKRRYVAAARLWADAFTADPKLAEDPLAGHRSNAARGAALAAAGQGLDTGPLDDQDRVCWRKQALQWLRADLEAYARLLARGEREGRGLVRQRLRHWQCDPGRAGLRDPADEQDACLRFWVEVQALLSQAEAAQ
jgi:eukaryotic-like serine/threonine-protein kinase